MILYVETGKSRIPASEQISLTTHINYSKNPPRRHLSHTPSINLLPVFVNLIITSQKIASDIDYVKNEQEIGSQVSLKSRLYDILTQFRDLISFPRRSSAIPNPNGTHALYTESVYSFDSHSNVVGTYILNLERGDSFLFSNDPLAVSYNWLGEGTALVWEKQVENFWGLWIGDASIPENK